MIDNRFLSERVNQLRNWGIDFVQADLLEKDDVDSIKIKKKLPGKKIKSIEVLVKIENSK